MFQHYNDDKFRKIIDEFILSSSENESIKYILRNIDFEAFKVGISFYQMIFTLIQKNAIQNRKSKIKQITKSTYKKLFYKPFNNASVEKITGLVEYLKRN